MESMGRSQRILLFDIDGTLLITNGAGTRAMNRAFGRLLSLPDGQDALDGLEIAGRSDAWIVQETLRAHGEPHDGAVRREFLAAYAAELPRTLTECQGSLLPGIAPLLESLGGHDVVVGLGTGNFRRTAMAKLDYFGIQHHFRDGGFGEDSPERAAILAAGVRRLRGGEGEAEVVVVGDTVHDIAAGHAIGAKVVAVATGSGSQEELRAAGADVLLSDCADLDAALAAVIG